MDRSYNVFVDNGLYVLGYYLDKDINNISIEDIKNSTEVISQLFDKYNNCDYYKKNINMCFHNSYYTQKLKKLETRKEKIQKQYTAILNNLGNDEYCSICGERYIKLNLNDDYKTALSRCLMPRLHSNTFINYINNFQIINVCPICIYLSMLSLFNTYKSGKDIILYNSDNNEFLEDYTFEMQKQLEQNILIDAKELKKDKTIIESIDDIRNFKKQNYEGYIQIIKFYNGGQDENYQENILSNRDLDFIDKLENKSLLSEFKQKNLYYLLIENKLQNSYLKYIITDNKLNISMELFYEIEEEYCKVNKKELQLIKDMCKKIYEINTKDEVKELNNIINLNQFENLLIKWNKQYNEETNYLLFDTDEFNNICNYKKFTFTKNRMIIEFMMLNNKKINNTEVI